MKTTSSYFQKYKEIEIIGRGSFGTANLVQSSEDGMEYIAKKVVLGSLTQKEVDSAQLEVRLLRELNHPNIVQYKECFIEDGLLITIMEYCEEGDLKNKITKVSEANDHFGEIQIFKWFTQVLSAIEYIHRNKILHRDIKTSNIFLKADGAVKIGDFGIAKAFENTNEIAMTVIGTPYYLSPEVCENKPYTYKSDIWALGCVLYEMNALKNAFTAKNLLSLIYKIVRDDFDPLPSYVSPDMTELIRQLLTKDEASRPSALEILENKILLKFMNDDHKQPATNFEFIKKKEENRIEEVTLSCPEKSNEITNDTIRVVSLLDQDILKKPQNAVQDHENSLDDISTFQLSFETQQQQSHSKMVSSINDDTDDKPQHHKSYQQRLRNIQRMIPKSRRHLSSKNQSFVEKEAESLQKTQKILQSSSRKPVFLNNFHLTPEEKDKKDSFEKTNESLELPDIIDPSEKKTTEKNDQLMQTCVSFECPKSFSPANNKAINLEESLDFEHQRDSERLSKIEHLAASNHQMRKTFKDSTKSNSKRDNKSSESGEDYEDDYEEYDEDYEEDFEEYCSENEEEGEVNYTNY